MGKNKQLLKPKQPDQSKHLSKPAQPPNADNLPPKFCLRNMRNKYSVEDCEKEEKVAFASRLYELSRNTWAELRLMPRHGKGYEIIERQAIKGDAIPQEITAEVNIIAFRFHG